MNDSHKDSVELVQRQNSNTKFCLHLVKFIVIVTQGLAKHMQMW